MNNVKYADFWSILKIKKLQLVKEDKYSKIFAGMYILTVLVKDGFAGVEEIKKEIETDMLSNIKKEVKRALKKKKEID